MRFTASLIALASLAGCGRNNSTPEPEKKQENTANHDDKGGGGTDKKVPVNDEAKMPPAELTDNNLPLAAKSRWRARTPFAEKDLTFSVSPVTEHTGYIDFRKADGSVPGVVSDVSVIAWMPEHNHGTGKRVPKTEPVAGYKARFTISNIIFTMEGAWELRVKAKIDGDEDYWVQKVKVVEK